MNSADREIFFKPIMTLDHQPDWRYFFKSLDDVKEQLRKADEDFAEDLLDLHNRIRFHAFLSKKFDLLQMRKPKRPMIQKGYKVLRETEVLLFDIKHDLETLGVLPSVLWEATTHDNLRN